MFHPTDEIRGKHLTAFNNQLEEELDQHAHRQQIKAERADETRGERTGITRMGAAISLITTAGRFA